MGSMSGLIADEEREARENRRIDRQRHKDECRILLDELIKNPKRQEMYHANETGCIILDFTNPMEAAADLIKENKALRSEIDTYRTTFRLLHRSMNLTLRQ